MTTTERGQFFGKNNLSTSAKSGYERAQPFKGACRECGEVGHEAWECQKEYTLETKRGRRFRCIPPAMLFKNGLVNEIGKPQ